MYGALHSFFLDAPNAAAKIGKSKILLDFFIMVAFSAYICYDDGCHLSKFAKNPVRSQITAVSKEIAKKDIVIDKMHMKNHVDQWCKEYCDPRKKPDLEKVIAVSTHYNKPL